MIPANKAFTAPREELAAYIDRIWEDGVLTNNGPLVQELESSLKRYLGIDHLYFVANGTIALYLSILGMEKKGEVITSAFSFVSTVNAIIQANCTPVLADIDPVTLDMDPDKVEALITDRTIAVLPTHLYGNTANIPAWEKISEKYDIDVVYDAAHAFGIKYKGRSVLTYGDISAISTHAYKVFNTAEGGLIGTPRQDLAEKIFQNRYFGKDHDDNFVSFGINGKSSEFNAAVGLVNLKYTENIIKRRKKISELYDEHLSEFPLRIPVKNKYTDSNFAYYPIIFPSEKDLIKTQDQLLKIGVATKRYFYPSLNHLPYLEPALPMPESEGLASTILVLPNHNAVREEDVAYIALAIKNSF